MALATIAKSTASKKGGFVNTLMINTSKVHPILGAVEAKRAIFYKTTEAVEITNEEFEFDTSSCIIRTIASSEEGRSSSDWIVGFN